MLRAKNFQLQQLYSENQYLGRFCQYYNTAKLFLSHRLPLIMVQVTYKVPLMQDLMNISPTNQLQL